MISIRYCDNFMLLNQCSMVDAVIDNNYGRPRVVVL